MLMTKEEFRMFFTDLREKAKARPKVAVGKKSPRCVVMPSSLRELTPWWRTAPTLVWVDVVTGRVLVNRWPLE